MRLLSLCLLFSMTLTPVALSAKGEIAGQFDYYVLALSWSPNWCSQEGEARQSPQCDADKDHGWIMHGLWPQFHRGYPSFCRTLERPPMRSMTASMQDIMGTPGLAWYQWKKHGSCTGLSASRYFDLARRAYATVVRPSVFRKVKDQIRLPASVVEQAFLKANPDLEPAGVTVTCKAGYIQEVRVCMSKDLQPIPCGRDVVKDCSLSDALFDPIK